MATITNPALLAIAQAKCLNNGALEKSRDLLDDRQREVVEARAVLEQAVARHVEQTKHHAQLQAERTELTKAEALLEKAIKEEKGQV